MAKIRVLIADDHACLRSGLSLLLNAQPDMEVVGEAAEGETALRLVQTIHPDVLTLDLTMPGSGIPTVERLHRECPQTRVLVLTMHDDPAYMRAAMAAGAAGYVVKVVEDIELLSAIRAVSKGRSFVDLSCSQRFVDGDAAATHDTIAGHAGLAALSERERECFQLLAAGYTNQEAADKLYLSVKTVETYRGRIRDKLGLKTRTDFIRYALEIGLLRSEAHGPDTPLSGKS